MEETALVAEPITELTVRSRIYTVRGVHVMLAHDLADIYQVSTNVFNQAIKRNEERFPQNFRFQLTKDELDEVITICDNPDRLRFSPAFISGPRSTTSARSASPVRPSTPSTSPKCWPSCRCSQLLDFLSGLSRTLLPYEVGAISPFGFVLIVYYHFSRDSRAARKAHKARVKPALGKPQTKRGVRSGSSRRQKYPPNFCRARIWGTR